MAIEKEQNIYAILEELDIKYEKYVHKPIFTVDEANECCAHIPGTHCKNLFLRNRKGDQHFLVVLNDSKRADLKQIAENIGATWLSFASEERLYKYLKLKPGSVTPFGLINDAEKKVRVVIDSELKATDKVCFHPDTNSVTLVVSYTDFEKFLKSRENEVTYIAI